MNDYADAGVLLPDARDLRDGKALMYRAVPLPQDDLRLAGALYVLAARPDDEAKAQVWAEVFGKRSVPMGPPLVGLAQCFWRPAQHELMLPWAQRYLDEVSAMSGDGGMMAIGSLMRSMFPTTGDQEFLERATAIAAEEGVNPTLRATLLAGTDTLTRVIRARG